MSRHAGASAWFFTLLVFFSITALCGGGYYEWHDQQRLGQLIFLLGTLPLIFILGEKELSVAASVSIVLIFLLGLISSLQAEWPIWALKEWSHYIGLVLLVVVLGDFIESEFKQYVVFGCMAAVGVVQAIQFLVYYISAFVSGFEVLDANLLFNGFSNPRFLGQFQVLLLPVLLVLAEHFKCAGKTNAMAVVVGVMSVHWCIAFMLGGRGALLAILLSHVLLLFLFGKFWRPVLKQLVAALIGMCLFAMLFRLLPGWLDVTPFVYDGLRVDLSSRDIIWRQAWQMFLDNPWLGAGPMHFAAQYNSIAAHPHQVILQWLAEWGGPATALALLLIWRGMLNGMRVLRSERSTINDAGLWAAFVGALILAQVDGVFVMPYSETWLAILAGVGAARWRASAFANSPQRYSLLLIAMPIVFLLAVIIFRSATSLPQVEREYLKINSVQLSPRFWLQGWISM